MLRATMACVLCIAAMVPGCRKQPQSESLVIGEEISSGVTVYDTLTAPRNEGYIYLREGEAVRVPGPTLAGAGGVFFLSGEKILVSDSTQYMASGIEVTVNERLDYRIAIEDFEYEVRLPRVELELEDGSARSDFIFLAQPNYGGVAHNIIVTAYLNGTEAGHSEPVTIRVR